MAVIPAPHAQPAPVPRAARPPGVALALAALPVAALLLARPVVTVEVPESFWLPAHALVEVVVVALGFATFAVQWFAAGSGVFQEARSRFLGAALFGAALFEALHLLAFPGMPPFLGQSSTERGIYYWLASRLWTTGALLAALAVRPDTEGRRVGRWPLLAVNVAAVLAVVALDLARPPHAALFFVEGRGLTPLKIAMEGLVAALAAAGAIVYARRARVTGDDANRTIAAALAITVLSEVCFMAYRSAYDAFNLLGHVYLVVAAWLLFAALFVASAVRPHRELQRLRAHVEGELAATIARLERTTEQREDLLRAVSHDLRNPLQVVLLHAERLGQLAAEGTRERRGSDAVLAAGRRMQAMLKELVESARAEGAAAALRPEAVALRPFLDALLAANAGALPVERVRNEVPDALPAVRADPARLDRVLVNLVGNALAYSAGEVVVRAEAADGAVAISVVDRGQGIAPEDLPRLFDRFQRAGREGGEGLGLGLYIVRKLVEAHGGRIHAESIPGEGSTFTFTLPVHPGA